MFVGLLAVRLLSQKGGETMTIKPIGFDASRMKEIGMKLIEESRTLLRDSMIHIATGCAILQFGPH